MKPTTPQREKNKFAFVEVQLVGTLGEHDYAYYPSEIEFDSAWEAKRAGIKEMGHDDFIVGEFEDEGKGKCIAVWLGKKRFTVWSEDYGYYVIGINRALGLLEE